jgi:hypothetical protein
MKRQSNKALAARIIELNNELDAMNARYNEVKAILDEADLNIDHCDLDCELHNLPFRINVVSEDLDSLLDERAARLLVKWDAKLAKIWPPKGRLK